MALNLRGIGVWGVIDATLDVMGEFGRAATESKNVKVIVKVGMDEINIRSFRGLLSESRELVYVPVLNRLWFYPAIRNEDGKNTAYCDMNNYVCLDWSKLAGIANAQKYSASLSFKYMRKWVTLKVTDVRGCIDFKVFNDKSGMQRNLGHQAALILTSKTFEWIHDVENKKLLLYCAITGALGWGVGILTYALLVK